MFTDVMKYDLFFPEKKMSHEKYVVSMIVPTPSKLQLCHMCSGCLYRLITLIFNFHN